MVLDSYKSDCTHCKTKNRLLLNKGIPFKQIEQAQQCYIRTYLCENCDGQNQVFINITELHKLEDKGYRVRTEQHISTAPSQSSTRSENRPLVSGKRQLPINTTPSHTKRVLMNADFPITETITMYRGEDAQEMDLEIEDKQAEAKNEPTTSRHTTPTGKNPTNTQTPTSKPAETWKTVEKPKRHGKHENKQPSDDLEPENYRATPIIVQDNRISDKDNLKQLLSYCKANNINIVHNGQNSALLKSPSRQAHLNTMSYLNANSVQHIEQPTTPRVKKVIIKGIYLGNVDLDTPDGKSNYEQSKNMIEEELLTDHKINITWMTIFKSGRTAVLQLAPGTDMKQVYSINKIIAQKVSITKYKPNNPRPIQCSNCLQFGHKMDACHKDKVMPTTSESTETNDVCALCFAGGHSATDKVCPKYTAACEKLQKKHPKQQGAKNPKPASTSEKELTPTPPAQPPPNAKATYSQAAKVSTRKQQQTPITKHQQEERKESQPNPQTASTHVARMTQDRSNSNVNGTELIAELSKFVRITGYSKTLTEVIQTVNKILEQTDNKLAMEELLKFINGV